MYKLNKWDVSFEGNDVFIKEDNSPFFYKGTVQGDNVIYQYAPPKYLQDFVRKVNKIHQWKINISDKEIIIENRRTGEIYRGCYIEKLGYLSLPNAPQYMKRYAARLFKEKLR